MPRNEYDHLVDKYHHRFLSDRMKALGISRAEAPYLGRIAKAGTIKMNTLITELPFHKSHSTRAISQMVEDGLILKEVNPEDKRGYYLSITEKGKIKAEKVKQIFTDWEELVATVITDEERKVIQNITKKIYHLLLDYYGEEDTINETND